MHRYDPATALVVVDVQNDFADPEGGLSVAGGDALVPVINAEIGRAAAGGALVVTTQDWHPAVTPHFAKDGGIWPVHCVAGTWGADLHPGLELPEGTASIHKGSSGEDGYSAFMMRDPRDGSTMPTALDGLLRSAKVHRLVIVGLATDYCVKASGLDAVRLGYDATVLTDAVAAVDLAAGDGERALDELAAAGVRLGRASDA